jgi:hypothetical protein
MQKFSLQRWHSNNLASDSANIVLQILQSQGSSTASVDFELYLVLHDIIKFSPKCIHNMCFSEINTVS